MDSPLVGFLFGGSLPFFTFRRFSKLLFDLVYGVEKAFT